MYKTSTFLTSLFSKFGVKDKTIRRQVVDLYRPIIDGILTDAPPSKRVIIFKELLPTIRTTIIYLEEVRSLKAGPLDAAAYVALKSSVAFSNYLIRKVGVRSDAPSTFSDIMKQVNLEDIACDIGICLQNLKTAEDDDKDGINAQLQVLLNDYNVVTGQALTIADVLHRQEAPDLEL